MHSKDTWSSFSPTYHVEAGGDDVGGLAATCQVFHESHFIEVEGRVQTVLIHLQLSAQSVDVVFCYRETRHIKQHEVSEEQQPFLLKHAHNSLFIMSLAWSKNNKSAHTCLQVSTDVYYTHPHLCGPSHATHT